MEDVLRQSFVPRVMVAASAECTSLYDHPMLASGNTVTSDSGLQVQLSPLPQFADNKSHIQMHDASNLEKMVSDLRDSQTSDFYHSIVRELVQSTFTPQHSQAFETFGHPVACILVVSSSNPSPISALTQLYQQSYYDCPPSMGSDFLRCVWYVHNTGTSETEANNVTTEDFTTVASQFGPHCFEVADFGEDAIRGAIETVATHSVYPYMHRVLKDWQQTNTTRRNQGGGFAFGKLLKKLVTSGPPRPEANIFFDVCREMQPHVASIPARRRTQDTDSAIADIDMQVRRLADVAFLLRDYKLAYAAYESLRKPFIAEQRWAHLGSCSEMLALCGALTGIGDVGAAVDTALYTYNSRLHLPTHAMRCVLVVCGCLVESGDQLLAAGLLSTTLLEIDPVYGSGSKPRETAMLMERISTAFEQRGWHRKAKLWLMLAEREWDRSTKQSPTLTN